ASITAIMAAPVFLTIIFSVCRKGTFTEPVPAAVTMTAPSRSSIMGSTFLFFLEKLWIGCFCKVFNPQYYILGKTCSVFFRKGVSSPVFNGIYCFKSLVISEFLLELLRIKPLVRPGRQYNQV